jgi:hypothetical protein
VSLSAFATFASGEHVHVGISGLHLARVDLDPQPIVGREHRVTVDACIAGDLREMLAETSRDPR